MNDSCGECFLFDRRTLQSPCESQLDEGARERGVVRTEDLELLLRHRDASLAAFAAAATSAGGGRRRRGRAAATLTGHFAAYRPRPSSVLVNTFIEWRLLFPLSLPSFSGELGTTNYPTDPLYGTYLLHASLCLDFGAGRTTSRWRYHCKNGAKMRAPVVQPSTLCFKKIWEEAVRGFYCLFKQISARGFKF